MPLATPESAPPKLAKLHLEVLDLIAGVPGYPNVRALELSCGDATLLQRLRDDGVAAIGTTYLGDDEDYIRERPYPEGVEVVRGVDLNKPLPFEDEAFDVVYSTEVIEHVESHATFVAETARVLRPGGHMVLTAPNTHRLLSRAHHLLSGLLEVKRQLAPWDQPAGTLYAYHHRCPDFAVLHWLMWAHGLRIVAARESLVLWPSKLLYLAAPLLRWTGDRLARRRRGINAGDPPPSADDDEGRSDMIRWLNGRVGMLSEQWILLARKTPLASPLQARQPGGVAT